jgi:hypothetical protein
MAQNNYLFFTPEPSYKSDKSAFYFNAAPFKKSLSYNEYMDPIGEECKSSNN